MVTAFSGNCDSAPDAEQGYGNYKSACNKYKLHMQVIYQELKICEIFSRIVCKVRGRYICIYHQTSNISHILVGNQIVDHSDVVGASPVSAAPTKSSFPT